MCEDYRAGRTTDLAHDEADRAAGKTIGCPVLALWGSSGLPANAGLDTLACWRDWAPDLRGFGHRQRPLSAGGEPGRDGAGVAGVLRRGIDSPRHDDDSTARPPFPARARSPSGCASTSGGSKPICAISRGLCRPDRGQPVQGRPIQSDLSRGDAAAPLCAAPQAAGQAVAFRACRRSRIPGDQRALSRKAFRSPSPCSIAPTKALSARRSSSWPMSRAACSGSRRCRRPMPPNARKSMTP